MKATPVLEKGQKVRREKGTRFVHLLERGKIGTMEVRNRIVMPPMGTNYADRDGFVTERLVQYYRARAEGGTGLIIVEVAAVAPEGKAIVNQVGVWADKFIPGLRRLAGAVKRHGARIAIQLHHAGRQTTSARTGHRPVAPSEIPCPVCRETPRALTVGEIQGLVEAFGHAARRAREAGFDAVEIHGTHGYLINQFLSPYSNKRTDEYGGDREKRLRFPLEVLAAVRRAAGNLPVLYRINANEYVEGGIDPAEGRTIALRLARAGVDAIHVSAGVYGSPAPMVATMATPDVPLAEYAAAIKEIVNIPVIAVGKFHDPEQGENVLAKKMADFISIGRGLITDSHFAKKVELGQIENIRKCIQCNQECIDPLLTQDRPVGCIYNARAGKEADYPLEHKATRTRKVVVVGGGPAGLEAARVAAERGHRVVLFEQSGELGGQGLLAKTPPYKDRFGEILRYLIRRTEALGVEFRKGIAASADMVLREKPDAVILATGARPLRPPLPGLEKAVTAWEILQGKVRPGNRVLIVGGGLTGCETAEFLAEKGHRVIILEMEHEPARDQSFTLRGELLTRLNLNPEVEIRTGVEVTAVGERSVTARGADGETVFADIDTIVLAAGARPHNPLEGPLKEHLADVFAVGDCDRPGNAAAAIHEAFRVAYHL